MEPYYTIVIPFVPREFATEWHPTEDKGPFMRLTRGNFKTVDAAIAWGREKLAGTPYEVKLINTPEIVITIEHDVKWNTWRVFTDEPTFEPRTFYGENYAIAYVDEITKTYQAEGARVVRSHKKASS